MDGEKRGGGESRAGWSNGGKGWSKVDGRIKDLRLQKGKVGRKVGDRYAVFFLYVFFCTS